MTDHSPRFNISKAVLEGLQKKHTIDNPMNRLLHKVEVVLGEIHGNIKPILKAGGGFDTLALKSTVFTLVQQGLEQFTKDEMHQLLAVIISDRVMSDIDKNPRGNDTPDLLS